VSGFAATKKNFSVGENILKLVAQNLILQIGDKT